MRCKAKKTISQVLRYRITRKRSKRNILAVKMVKREREKGRKKYYLVNK